MITYTYQAFESKYADQGLWDQIKNALHGLTDSQSDTVKFSLLRPKIRECKGSSHLRQRARYGRPQYFGHHLELHCF